MTNIRYGETMGYSLWRAPLFPAFNSKRWIFCSKRFVSVYIYSPAFKIRFYCLDLFASLATRHCSQNNLFVRSPVFSSVLLETKEKSTYWLNTHIYAHTLTSINKHTHTCIQIQVPTQTNKNTHTHSCVCQHSHSKTTRKTCMYTQKYRNTT